MAVLTEGKYPGEFMFSEGNGRIARDVGTLISGQNLVAGSVLGKITASGKWTMVAPAAGDGSEVARAILFAAVDASGGDKPCVLITRIAEVNQAELNFAALNGGQITTAIAQLAAQNILVRPAV
jgi:hypothetical protein